MHQPPLAGLVRSRDAGVAIDYLDPECLTQEPVILLLGKAGPFQFLTEEGHSGQKGDLQLHCRLSDGLVPAQRHPGGHEGRLELLEYRNG